MPFVTVPSAARTVVAVIAIGNPYRGDDGVGAALLAGLAARYGGDDRVRLVDLDGESVRMIEAWAGAPTVWIVDAVRTGHPPGTCREIAIDELAGIDDSGARLGGGHLLGLATAVDLARTLGRLPATLRVLGVEGERFDHGVGLTAAAERGVEGAVELLAGEIDAALAVA